MQEIEDLADSISIAFGCDYGATLMQLNDLVSRKGNGMDNKSIDEKVNGARKVGNRAQRRRFMKQFGLLNGATRKRTASMKVKR